jgi:hypothetical protein
MARIVLRVEEGFPTASWKDSIVWRLQSGRDRAVGLTSHLLVRRGYRLDKQQQVFRKRSIKYGCESESRSRWFG